MPSERLPQIDTAPLSPFLVHSQEGKVHYEKRGDRFFLDLDNGGLVAIAFPSFAEKTQFHTLIGRSVRVAGWSLGEPLRGDFDDLFYHFLFVKKWKLVEED